MRHLKFSNDSEIILEATNEPGTTPAKAINEAIDFVKIQELKSVDLKYGGYTMLIEPTVNVSEMVAEYRYWQSLQAEKVKNSITQ